MILLFDTNGNDKQKHVCELWLNPEVNDIVYGGSKGSGKSYLGCSLIFGDAFTYPGTHYFIARKQLNDLRKYTIPSIYEVFSHWGVTKKYYDYNGQDSFFTLYNKSKVYLLDARALPSDPQYQRFGSMQMTRGWCEETGEFEELAKNGLAASIGRWKNDIYNLPAKLLQTCNPSKNYLYREYYQKDKLGKLEPHKRFVQALPQDNKKLPPGYLENLRKQLSPNEIQRLLNGNWEYDDDPATLIHYEKILDCFTNNFDTLKGKKHLTIDVARFGKDTDKFGVWDGFRVKLITRKGLKVTETAQFARDLQNKYNIPNGNTIADEDGIGGGVVDILGCKGFVNNSRPLPNPEQPQIDEKGNIKPENYNNLKSQCTFRMAKRINENGIYIECDEVDKPEVIQEMEWVKQDKMDNDGKMQVLPKDKIKEVIGRSPDNWDCLMMREYFELAPRFIVAVA